MAPNRLAAAVKSRRRAGGGLLDLTVSSPTRVGLDYPSEAIREALAGQDAYAYDPDPMGDPVARTAIAHWYGARGYAVDPDRIVLTPGTSESYGWLFKLLCDPGETILVPRPSYPLFEFLATLESVRVASYPLRYDLRWRIDRATLVELTETTELGKSSLGDGRVAGSRGATRAIVVVNPNNPTGSFLTRPELSFLGEIAASKGLALISDEVFSTYPLEPESPEDRVTSILGRDEVPAFVLDGLSKSAGLPGMKVGWIVVLGPEAFLRSALDRLEVIADTYLPVGSPVQRALPRLIELGEQVARQIRRRLAANIAALREAVGSAASCELLTVEGGWSAVLRVPRKAPEEDLCLELLEKDGVLVQPGWFFDFDSEAYLVVSLLAPEADFRNGIARVLARAG